MARRIVLTGGLSGGHTFPLIAVSRALREESAGKSDIEFLFIGSRGPFENTAFTEEGIPMKFIWTAKWRRYFSLLNFLDIFKFPIACLQALWHLLFSMPDAVFAKGGAASVPVVLAAWVYRIPIMLHDSDAVAGRANRFLSRFATRISIAYDYTRQFFPPEKTVLTGNPIRKELLGGSAERASEMYHFSSEEPVVFVIGGSLGARNLNDAFLKVLPLLLGKHIQVIHITGEEKYDDVLHLAGQYGIKSGSGGYMALPFLSADKLADVYALATLVISRAGAGSIAEIAALRKPSILVPLPTAANNEQRMNAYEIAENGGALVLEEQNLGEHILLSRILELLADETLRQKMVEKIARFSHPDAATEIARGIIEML